MPLTDLFKNGSANEIIAELKSKRTTELPDAEQAKKAIDPKKHDIHDPILRPDKRIKVDNGIEGEKVYDAGEESGNYRIEKVARVSFALQYLIINRAV